MRPVRSVECRRRPDRLRPVQHEQREERQLPHLREDGAIGGAEIGQAGDTLNYLEADEGGTIAVPARLLRDAEQLQSAVPVPLVAEYRTGA